MAPPKKSEKKPVKKPKSTNGCFIITTLLLILVAISLAATFYFLFLRPGPATPPPPAPATTAQPPPAAQAPPAQKSAQAVSPEPQPPPAPATTETTTTTEPPQASLPPAPPAASPHEATAGARLAIIIDDIGNTKKIAEEIIALDLPLAFSVLPHTPHANHLASLAKARGRDILLHLPMEASDPKWTSGPGSLLLSMSKAELLATIDQDLDTPYRPIGINNHMGSKFSEDPVAMRLFLTAIKPRGLFFIDSLTSVDSVGYTLARDMGVRTAKRDVFLDNEQDHTKILAQIGRLISLAQKHGSAIGIGHPYPATLEALRAARSRLGQGVTMVPVHELVH